MVQAENPCPFENLPPTQQTTHKTTFIPDPNPLRPDIIQEIKSMNIGNPDQNAICALSSVLAKLNLSPDSVTGTCRRCARLIAVSVRKGSI